MISIRLEKEIRDAAAALEVAQEGGDLGVIFGAILRLGDLQDRRARLARVTLEQAEAVWSRPRVGNTLKREQQAGNTLKREQQAAGGVA
jgi:hypothetical protein